MTHAVAVWGLLAMTAPALSAAQTHFTPVWSGTPYLAMNVYVTSAACDGTPVGAGDEIAVFDGSVCVGASLLAGPVLPGAPLSMVVSMDDPITPGLDGFGAGHSITWRIWKKGEGYEYQDSAVGRNYVAGDGTFSPQGTAVLSLTALGISFQLSDFRATVQNQNTVVLSWATLTEKRNLGFRSQRSNDSTGGFVVIPGSLVAGAGTTLQQHSYSYTDGSASPGVWYYRLEQIDSSGTSHFTRAIRVNIVASVTDHQPPSKFQLLQNYPNPFNPSTVIRGEWPVASHVEMAVYDMLGREVALLADGRYQEGRYTFTFDATGLAGGVYMCRLHARPVADGQAGSFVATRKMALVR